MTCLMLPCYNLNLLNISMLFFCLPATACPHCCSLLSCFVTSPSSSWRTIFTLTFLSFNPTSSSLRLNSFLIWLHSIFTPSSFFLSPSLPSLCFSLTPVSPNSRHISLRVRLGGADRTRWTDPPFGSYVGGSSVLQCGGGKPSLATSSFPFLSLPPVLLLSYYGSNCLLQC